METTLACKRCNSTEFRKSGFMNGKQRYQCKSCKMNFTEGDNRRKYSDEVRDKAISIYLEGNGFRRTERLLKKTLGINVAHQLIIKWVKAESKKARFKRSREQGREIAILEVDELFTFVKKKTIES